MDAGSSTSLTVEAHGEPYWSCHPFLPWPALVALLFLMVLLVWWSYRHTSRPVGPRRRFALVALRLLTALIVWLALLCPVRIQELRWRQKGFCMLTLDASSSMNIKDGPRGLSRWAFAQQLLEEHGEDLRRLDEAYEVRRFVFDTVPVETPRLPGEAGRAGNARAEGRTTDLAALLERVSAECQGTPCAGVLLISDGRHNVPKDPLPIARRLKESGVPLFVVGVGREAAPSDYCDVNVRWLDVPERAFVNSEVSIGVDLDAHLPQAASVPMTFTVNGEVIHSETVDLPSGSSSRRVVLRYVPTALGFHRVQVSTAPLPGEASEENNRQIACFRVFRSRLNVWYIEGTLRKEFGALRAALSTAPNMTLRALNAFDQAGGAAADATILPETDGEWGETRLVIIGDLPASRFTSAQLQRLAKRVEEGGALLMLGGGSTLGQGGWATSPLADVLPVELGGSPKLVAGPFSLQAATDGHPALRFDPDAQVSIDVLRRLPPVPWLNQTSSVKPAAHVLLRAEHHPLLVVQDFGQGRSAVFASAETWQWAVKAGQMVAQQVFWRNLVTWLTRSDYRESDKVVFAESDRLRGKEGEEFHFSIQVQPTEKTADRVSTARVRALLELGGQVKKVWDLGRGAGAYHVEAAPQTAGSYTFRALAMGPGDEPLGVDSVEFQVDTIDLEHHTPKANLRLLQHLAQQSDGFYYDAEHAGRAFAQLLQRPVGFSKLIRHKQDVWSHWAVFVGFVVLLCGEWMLRKRSNLP
jgi:hypothetical protein